MSVNIPPAFPPVLLFLGGLSLSHLFFSVNCSVRVLLWFSYSVFFMLRVFESFFWVLASSVNPPINDGIKQE